MSRRSRSGWWRHRVCPSECPCDARKLRGVDGAAVDRARRAQRRVGALTVLLLSASGGLSATGAHATDPDSGADLGANRAWIIGRTGAADTATGATARASDQADPGQDQGPPAEDLTAVLTRIDGAPGPAADPGVGAAPDDTGRDADARPEGLRAPQERRPIGAPATIAHGPGSDTGDPAVRPLLDRLGAPFGEIIRVGGALAGVLVILLALRQVARRAGLAARATGRPSGVVEVLARYPVQGGQTLVVLRFARRIILAHQGGGGMQALSEVTDPDEVARLLARLEAGSNERDAARFRSVLRHFEDEHDAVERRGRHPVADQLQAGPHTVEVVDLTKSGRRRRETARSASL